MNMHLENRFFPVIIGSGRSGTTWIQDVLAQSNELRTVFEPLHPVVMPLMQKHAYQFLGRDESNQELEVYLSDVFTGRHKSIWTDYRVRPDRLFPYPVNLSSFRKVHEYLARWRKLFRQMSMYRKRSGQPVITKFIRANLMWPWILKHFDVRIVHIIRHPCAVIESKLRLGGDDWDVEQELARYLSQQAVNGWVNTYMSTEEICALSAPGRYALIWCIENAMLPSDSDSRVLKVYFETLASHDPILWKKVCEHLHLKNVPDSYLLSKPSQQARPENKNTLYDKKMTSNWRSRMNDCSLREIENVLLRFKITDYLVGDLDISVKGN